jgi:hypothetical protein
MLKVLAAAGRAEIDHGVTLSGMETSSDRVGHESSELPQLAILKPSID